MIPPGMVVFLLGLILAVLLLGRSRFLRLLWCVCLSGALGLVCGFGAHLVGVSDEVAAGVGFLAFIAVTVVQVAFVVVDRVVGLDALVGRWFGLTEVEIRQEGRFKRRTMAALSRGAFDEARAVFDKQTRWETERARLRDKQETGGEGS
jgi:hypothetical protein